MAVTVTNEDCMNLMARYPDKYFDLAVVDPPYGDAGGSAAWDRRGRLPPAGRGAKYAMTERGGGAGDKKYGNNLMEWDIAPPPEYFAELFRVSKKQIIWGGNYFALPPSRNFIIWRKLTISENFTMAMAEYAWASMPGNAKVIERAPQDKERFHPAQKPVEIYKKLLQWYSKPGDKILDTHLGSGSSAIACIDMGCELTGCEIAPEYYKKAMTRIKRHLSQRELFERAELRGQNTLFETAGKNDCGF
jgi:site-specific DNA-methyltransferase (adenine-specific)